MKFIKLNDAGETRYLVRHWLRWYTLLEGGGLLSTKGWFKEARKR